MGEVIGLQLGNVSEIEYRFKKSNGEWMWCLSRDAVFNKNENGETTQFMGTFIDITDRKQAERSLTQLNGKLESLVHERTAQLEKSLSTQELLMKEIHHRVKNNLQLLSSWFNLYISKENNQKIINAINDCKNNIHTLALVYSSLYQTNNLTEIDFTDYLKNLCFHIENSMNGGRPIKIILNLQPVKISIDNTITCGLIINELITNCYKHAFPNNKEGVITIDLKLTNQNIILSIKDNGVGLPNTSSSSSFGLGMVQTLVGQLDGQLKIDSTNAGLTSTLTFALPPIKATTI
jgi:two-component sensor histidine kinase